MESKSEDIQPDVNPQPDSLEPVTAQATSKPKSKRPTSAQKAPAKASESADEVRGSILLHSIRVRKNLLAHAPARVFKVAEDPDGPGEPQVNNNGESSTKPSVKSEDSLPPTKRAQKAHKKSVMKVC